MVNPRSLVLRLALLASFGLTASGQAVGSIRGVVDDLEYGDRLEGVEVTISETGQKATTSDQGNYLLANVPPGTYTLVFAREGYLRDAKPGVVVRANVVEVVDFKLGGDFETGDVVPATEPPDLGTGTEASLLQLRLETPALLDSISADLMSRAGASDAASAMSFIAGATVKDGKSAVIRGLPDRYVSSQMNGVRLPTADEDKRAVELDQFPSAIIESIQVSKTFTPDQQGDASGGAVNVLLKGIPSSEFFFKFRSQIGFNSQAGFRSDFLGYSDGGVGFWGRESQNRPQQFENIGMNWTGSVGVSPIDAPVDNKWSAAVGGNHVFEDSGIKLGGFASFFYERDSSYYDNGINEQYWIDQPGQGLVPRLTQIQGTDDFKTNLYDIERGQRSVRWGSLMTAGVTWEEQSLRATYLYTRTAEDTAILAEDTRGKSFFFPGYDPTDPTSPGYDEPSAAPWLRLETLDYIERTTSTFQFNGRHLIPVGEWGDEGYFRLLNPELDWTVAFSQATATQPDKRLFGSVWTPPREVFGVTLPAAFRPFKPDANFTLGNLQRIFKKITEDSEQYQINLKIPFEQWTKTKGYFKFGYFSDSVDRNFDQDTYSNFNDAGAFFEGDFDEFWSANWTMENHPITAAELDVDYIGKLDVSAYYFMLDLPITDRFKVTGGARIETTEISTVNIPEPEALWFPPGGTGQTTLAPGDGDAAIKQTNLLPSIGVEYRPIDQVTMRFAYNETIARQTFKELTPILQQEFLGGPVFIGNPELAISNVENWDVRVDFRPYDGGLLSASWFRKDITNAIEYVQRLEIFNFTTAVNYPSGRLTGVELEMRQDLGYFWDKLEGLSVGANATLISSEVELTEEEILTFAGPAIDVDLRTREMTNAPDYLYNLYLTYDVPDLGTQLSLFWSVTGDVLVAGAGEANNNFVPNLYAKGYGTLNFSLSQPIGDHFRLRFQAKNLTNPEIETVLRGDVIEDDVVTTSFTRGIDFSLTLSADFTF